MSAQASPRPRPSRSVGRIARSLGSGAALLLVVATVGLLLIWRPAGPAGEDLVLLPTHRELNSYPAALLEAMLLREGDCVYAEELHSGTRYLVIWPPGTWLADGSRPAEVVGRDGNVIAAMGEAVRVGGGEMPSLEFLRTLLEHDIPEPCVGGHYWLASDVESAWGAAAAASWRIDPAQAPGLDSTSVAIVLRENECASGRTPEGRVQEPKVVYERDRIVISISVRTWPGDCPSNPDYPLVVELSEPLGDRELVDGSDGGIRWSTPENATPRPTEQLSAESIVVVSLRYADPQPGAPSPWIGGYAAFATLYDSDDVAHETAELAELEAVTWTVGAGTYRLETDVQAVSDTITLDEQGNPVRQMLGSVATCSARLELSAERDTSVVVTLQGGMREEGCSIDADAPTPSVRPPLPTPSPIPTTSGSWRKLPTAPIEDGLEPTGVWTGTEFVVWGSAGISDGAAYNPTIDTWRPLPIGPGGSRRQLNAAWTGELIIAWDGGSTMGGSRLPDGGIYDPTTDTRRPIAPGRLTSDYGQALAWTGTQLLVLTPDMQAATYDPATDRWRDLPSPPLPEGPVIAEWTGTAWLVIAMGGEPRAPAPAASYDPDSGTWRTLAPSLLTALDEGLDVVWTGDRHIALRAFEGDVAYDPRLDRWDTVEAPGCQVTTSERFPAVWTGQAILTQRFLVDPATSECRQLPPAPQRDGWSSNVHEFGAVAWTGTEFLVWGAGAGGDIDVAPADGAAFELP